MSRLYKGSCNTYTDLNGNYGYVEYNSIKEYHDYINNKERVRGRDRSSESGDSGWSGSSSLEEASELMIKGDKESLSIMKKHKSKTDSLFKDHVVDKVRTVNSVEGFQPIVANAIMGLPESMIKTERKPNKVKVVDIFYNSSASAGVDKDEIAFKGAMLLSTIEQLEKNGYRVNLYVGKVSYNDGDIFGHIVNIKQAMSPLNMLKTSFYIIHPSFLRRICFKIDETEERIKDCTNDGYGQATNYSSIRDIVKGTFNKDMLFFDGNVDIDSDNSDDDNMKAINKMLKGLINKDI